MMQASDILLHSKDSDRTERVIFPITRYDNIIAAPRFLNLGMDIAKYTSVEAFFQQSGERKSHHEPERIKSEFYAWGLDMYGKMPIMCSGFNLLGSLGLADYNVKYKFKPSGSVDKQRMGYRAGIGLSYDFTHNVSMRVMGRYSYIGMKNLNHIMEMTAGLSYAF